MQEQLVARTVVHNPSAKAQGEGFKRNSLSGKFRPARKAERLGDCLEEGPGEIAMAVKMRPTYTRTKRPRGALLQLDIVSVFRTV